MRAQISHYCALIGQDPLLVQGAGGNVSWKDGDVLWIKASGTWLRDADKQDIFVPVALPELQAALCGGQFDAPPRTLGDTRLKPSIETVLHALLPQKVVVHVHAIEPLSWLVRADATTRIAQRMPTSFKHVVVPYRKPGKELAQAVCEALQATPDARAVLLMNHGVVIAGDTLADVQASLAELQEALPAAAMQDESIPPQVPQPLSLSGSQTLSPLTNDSLHRLATRPDLFKRVRHDWALYPDHVVFLGAQAITFDCVQSALAAAQTNQIPPDMPLFIQDLGVFSIATLAESKLAQLRCYQNVIERIAPTTTLRSLPLDDIAALLNWDAERYRQQLAK